MSYLPNPKFFNVLGDYENLSTMNSLISGILSFGHKVDMYHRYEGCPEGKIIPFSFPYGRTIKIKFPKEGTPQAEVIRLSFWLREFLVEKCAFGTSQHYAVTEKDLSEAFYSFIGETPKKPTAFSGLMDLAINSKDFYAHLKIKRSSIGRLRAYMGINLKEPKPRIIPKSSIRESQRATGQLPKVERRKRMVKAAPPIVQSRSINTQFQVPISELQSSSTTTPMYQSPFVAPIPTTSEYQPQSTNSQDLPDSYYWATPTAGALQQQIYNPFQPVIQSQPQQYFTPDMHQFQTQQLIPNQSQQYFIPTQTITQFQPQQSFPIQQQSQQYFIPNQYQQSPTIQPQEQSQERIDEIIEQRPEPDFSVVELIDEYQVNPVPKSIKKVASPVYEPIVIPPELSPSRRPETYMHGDKEIILSIPYGGINGPTSSMTYNQPALFDLIPSGPYAPPMTADGLPMFVSSYTGCIMPTVVTVDVSLERANTRSKRRPTVAPQIKGRRRGKK